MLNGTVSGVQLQPRIQIQKNNAHFLGSLVCPKTERSTSTLHDDVGAKAAQYTSLVILAGVQIRNDSVVGVREASIASWTGSALLWHSLLRETKCIRAISTEYVALPRISPVSCLIMKNGTDKFAHLQVVTRARSPSSFLHFSELQRSTCSMSMIVMTIRIAQ